MSDFGKINTMEAVLDFKQLPHTPGSPPNFDIENESSGVLSIDFLAEANQTVNINGQQKNGQRLVIKIENDGVLPRTTTFGNGMVSSGTLVGIASTVSMVEFISDGTTFYEISRTANI